MYGLVSWDSQFSVEEFYTAMLKEMMDDFSLARVDWLRWDKEQAK